MKCQVCGREGAEEEALIYLGSGRSWSLQLCKECKGEMPSSRSGTYMVVPVGASCTPQGEED